MFYIYAQNDDTFYSPDESTFTVSKANGSKPGQILSGHVKSSDTVYYGGVVYCRCSTVLKNIKMWIQFSEDQKTIVSATVFFLAKESNLDSLNCQVFQPTNHYYQLHKPYVIEAGGISKMELRGNSGNRPQCNLDFNGKISGNHVSGKLHLRRTDQQPPLAYQINIPIELK